MSLFSQSKIDSIERSILEMTVEDKMAVIDKIYVKQPYLLTLVLAQGRMGVSMEKIDFALDFLVLCHLLSETVSSIWPQVSEQELDRQMARHTAIVKFWDGAGAGAPEGTSMQQYIKSHPEPELLMFSVLKVRKWLKSVRAEECDKYVMMTVMCIINCLSYGYGASVPKSSLQARRPRRASP